MAAVWPATAVRQLVALHQLDALDSAQQRLRNTLVDTVVKHVGAGTQIVRGPDSDPMWDDWILPKLIGT